MNELLPADRYGAGMTDRFGLGWYLSGLAWAFRRVRIEDHSAERIRRAFELGPIVYVLHTPSMVDWLALNRVLAFRRLPLPVYTHDLQADWFRPLSEFFRLRLERLQQGAPPDALASGWLARTIAEGRPSCLFVAPRADPLSVFGFERSQGIDPLTVLEQAQQLSERPVQVVPVVVLWEHSRPEGVVGEFVAGLEELPGPFARLWSLANATDPLVQVGEPVSVREFQQRYAAEPEGRRLKMLRLLLRRYLYREAQVVLGPRTRAWGEVRRHVLQSPEIHALVNQEAQSSNTPQAEVARSVAKIYDRVAAHFSGRYLRVASWITRQIWRRIYSGIDIRPEDLERIREALRKGTPILIPCHRSHLDYMLLSSILYDHDIAIPHIVAGDNLAFWPVGAIFRRMGAFFIRRSFSGDRLFPTVFARYLRELIRMEVPIEFFIEGGRSRTGKLLPPKTGVLSMVFDAAVHDSRERNVSLLPIYIGYARLAEERVFAHELSGAQKERESVSGVIKASRVLGQRFGRVHVRVGEALSVDKEAGAWTELSKEARSERLWRTGMRLLHRINKESLILPVALTALAVMAHGRRGIRHEDLLMRAERFLGYLRAEGVQEPAGLRPVASLVDEAVKALLAGRMLRSHEGDGAKVYAIDPDRRIRLEWYKNTLLTPLATVSWYCAAIRAQGQDILNLQEVDRLFDRQRAVFVREFILDPDMSQAELREEARQRLLRWGLLVPELEGLRVRDRSHIGELANLTTNLLESYLLVIRVLKKGATDVPKAAMTLGKTLVAVDELSRPEALSLQNLQHAAKYLSGREDLPMIEADLTLLMEGKA